MENITTSIALYLDIMIPEARQFILFENDITPIKITQQERGKSKQKRERRKIKNPLLPPLSRTKVRRKKKKDQSPLKKREDMGHLKALKENAIIGLSRGCIRKADPQPSNP